LIVNQNYYPSWRAADGRKLGSYHGLLSVPVTPADSVIELSYQRDSFYFGAAISAVCWLGLLLLIGKRGARGDTRVASLPSSRA
jgi:nitrate reductase gamma subunit